MQFKTWFKKQYLKFFLKNMDKVKIVCGASNTKFDGWVSFNVDTLNITKDEDFKYFFDDKLIDNILLEHVIEHLEYKDFIVFLQIAKKYLKKGATLRIAVPDGNHPSQYVRELTGANGTEPGADYHKYFYTIDDMTQIASQLGFKLVKLEFFNAKGKFVCNDYNFDNGYISRCSKNYKGRFTDNIDEYNKMINTVPIGLQEQFIKYNISYISLLVDLIND